MSFSKTIMLGRVGAEPKRIDKGEGFVALRLAVDRPTRERVTDWVDCVAFGKTAEIIEQYVKKGDQVLLEGRVEPHGYEGRDGYVAGLRLVANSVTLVGGKREGAAQEPPQSTSGVPARAKPAPSNAQPAADAVDDDLPF